ncbi:sensor histidine kinase [Algoriphagus halophilus]|uniref:Histidine kinase n=1 Tax=Algoriphagus halophilus TaxID=226505 RepID=A0A1N6DRV2_9BACT|nr:histidine kinase [Algoriphagus halophilus]SIN73506.1 Histidine kinase [Algoriphagus halophilus]
MEKSISFILAFFLTGSIGLYLLYNRGLIYSLSTVSWTMALFIVLVVLASLIISFGYLSISKLQPWDKGHVTRSVLIVFLIGGSITLFSYLLEFLMTQVVEEDSTFPDNTMTLKGGIVGLIVSLALTWIDYSWFAFARFSKETIQGMRDTRKKEELQFTLLRSQLTPHFLFNTLNSASLLISTQPEKVEEFIRKLAFNFSNLMQHGIQPLNTLAREIEIIDNYMHLMQVRYGDKVILEKKIKPEFNTQLLPALGIQLLVENALKHNVASLENPVKIIITADHEKIAVANTITQKPLNVKSNGVGLQNLKERYDYHGHSSPTIYQSEGFFFVCLPYIKQKTTKA